MMPDEFDGLQRQHPHFRHFPTLTSASAEWTGLRGRVQEHVVAFSRGLPDAVDVLSRDDVLAHVADIVRATPLPVSADYQNGYGRTGDELAASVAACAATGVAGLSIEDANGAGGLFERAEAIERVRIARSADRDVVLTHPS